MVYGHTVKKNGVLYPAGTNVPDNTPKIINKDVKVEETETQKRQYNKKPKTEE